MANCSCNELATPRFLWWNNATELFFAPLMCRRMCACEEWTRSGLTGIDVVLPRSLWGRFLVSLRRCSLTCVVYNGDVWTLEKHLVAILDWGLPVKVSANGSVAFVRSCLPQIYGAAYRKHMLKRRIRIGWCNDIAIRPRHGDGLLGILFRLVDTAGKIQLEC